MSSRSKSIRSKLKMTGERSKRAASQSSSTADSRSIISMSRDDSAFAFDPRTLKDEFFSSTPGTTQDMAIPDSNTATHEMQQYRSRSETRKETRKRSSVTMAASGDYLGRDTPESKYSSRAGSTGTRPSVTHFSRPLQQVRSSPVKTTDSSESLNPDNLASEWSKGLDLGSGDGKLLYSSISTPGPSTPAEDDGIDPLSQPLRTERPPQRQNDYWKDPFAQPLIARKTPSPPPVEKNPFRNPSYAGWEAIASDDVGDLERQRSQSTKSQAPSQMSHSSLRTKLDDLKSDTYSVSSSVRKPRPYSYYQEPKQKYVKVRRPRPYIFGFCPASFSTRTIILVTIGIVMSTALILGLGIGLWQARLNSGADGGPRTWRPAIGTTWQIQLGSNIKTPISTRAAVYDIDLFDNNATIIDEMHKVGRRVICYFSAGTHENWRPDANQFATSAIGKALPNWAGEQWLDIRSDSVRTLMAARIELARAKGCDGVDPDNVDGYETSAEYATSQERTGFPLSVQDAISFVRFLATTAHAADLAIGLKNAPELINGTLDVLDWEINESCVSDNSCKLYHPFIQAGKPVFHIEYASNASSSVLHQSCGAAGTSMFSTLIKKKALDSWVAECPIGDPAFGSD